MVKNYNVGNLPYSVDDAHLKANSARSVKWNPHA